MRRGRAPAHGRASATAPKLGVLIIGAGDDPHVVAVERELRGMGVECRIFDQYHHETAALFKGGSVAGVWPFEAWLRGFDGAAIWLRVKGPSPTAPEAFHDPAQTPDSPCGPYVQRQFLRSEWRTFTRSLVAVLRRRVRGVRLVNEGEFTRAAHCKPVQLELATRLGLRAPRTFIGNAATEFTAAFPQTTVLYKPLGDLPVAGRGAALPALLPKRALLANDLMTSAPAIYQEHIVKKLEKRITLTHAAVHVADIDSQRLRGTRLDWRLGSFVDDLFSVGSLPPATVELLRDYMRALRLDVCAFDFAITPDDEAIFFEGNPAGQWLWLEHALGVPMSRDIALAIRTSAAGARPH